MKILRNKVYDDLINKHIRNPYKTMVAEPISYAAIPRLIEQYPEWADCVFDRLARIYTHIDESLFPNDTTGQTIINELLSRGVYFI